MLHTAVYIELEKDVPKVKELIAEAADAAFALFEYPFDACVDVTLTDDAGIHEVNLEARQVDRPTDVLSFPMLEFDHGVYKGNPQLDRDPETGRLFLGDILISVDRVREQAEEYGHSPERECAYLTVHSMLHLLGFDHVDEGPQKAAMRKKEEEALAAMGLARGE